MHDCGILTCFVSASLSQLLNVCLSTVLAKGEMEPERKETRSKVDEDRKHEYPFNSCYAYIDPACPVSGGLRFISRFSSLMGGAEVSQFARLSAFKPFPGTLCCVIGQDFKAEKRTKHAQALALTQAPCLKK